MSYKLLGILMGLLCCLSVMAVTFSPDAKRNCQLADSLNGTVTLIFATDCAHFALPADSLLHVWVSGSMNDYEDFTLELTNFSEDSCFYRTFPCAELLSPGNSGQPEFVFYIQKTDSSFANLYHQDMRSAQMDSGIAFFDTYPYTLIMMPCGPDYFTTNQNELYARGLEAQEIRPLSDFNLSDSVDQHRISNFRLTPGTRCLYRSYHPYFPSNPRYDTEQQRLFWVAELGRQAGIQSDISLTGNLQSKAGQWYLCGGDSFQIEIPDYQRALIESGNILYVGEKVGGNPSVAQCYYHSDEMPFALWMSEVVAFIADTTHPAPFQIHCAIGADRTGMVCAVIAALCGTDWATIAADYQETSNMKIQAYRHPNRLRYAMQRLTGIEPGQSNPAQLAAAIRHHFVDDLAVLTNTQIDAMVARLTQSTTTALYTTLPEDSFSGYDLLGRPVDDTYKGAKIFKGKKCL